MSRLNFTIEKKNIFPFASRLVINVGNGGVKNKMLKNRLILMRKKYFVQIYKRNQHTKNHIDWIKNEVTREV